MHQNWLIRKGCALDVPDLIPFFKEHAAFGQAGFQEMDQENKFRQALKDKVVHCLLVEMKDKV